MLLSCIAVIIGLLTDFLNTATIDADLIYCMQKLLSYNEKYNDLLKKNVSL